MFILKFLWHYPVRLTAYIKNNFWNVFFLIIALYTFLCSIHIDVINRNHNDFVSLPYQFLFVQKQELPLDVLSGGSIEENSGGNQQANRSNLYVFVLDVSSSMTKVNLNSHLHRKYVEGIAAVNDQFGYNIISAGNHPTRMELAKVRLYELLLELLIKKRKNAADEFSIWILGDKGRLAFPLDKKIKIGRNTIKDAIVKIDGLKQETNEEANYVSLFQRFSNVYKDELSENRLNQGEDSFFILTILSDLLPDTKKQYKARSKRLEQNWEQLEEKIEQISHSRTIINMIVFSEDEPDNQKTILPLLERNIDAFKLNKFFMGGGTGTKVLYSVKSSKEDIKFYYSTSYDISDTSFVIKSTTKDPYRIEIDLPAAINNIDIPKISLHCEKLGAIGDGIGQIKKIHSGGSPFRVTLYKNQKVKLSLRNRFHSIHPAPILRLRIDNENETLLIPITILKIFPHWVSIMFVFLQLFLLLSLVLKMIAWLTKERVTPQEVIDDYTAYGRQPYAEEKIVEKRRKPRPKKDSILVFVFPLLVLTSLVYFLSQQLCTSSKAAGKDKVPYLAGVEEVREKLNAIYSTKHFEIFRYTGDELVQGYQGIYYWIDIKDAVAGEPIKFEEGEYTIEDYSKKFLKSINKFGDEVLKKLKHKVPYKIFIKGQADRLGNKTFSRSFDPDFRPGKIKYYERLKGGGDTKFLPSIGITQAKEPIYNRDLPNLRAAFIQKKFHDLYKEERGLTAILEGDVALEISEEYRNAILILWVKWPRKPHK